MPASRARSEVLSFPMSRYSQFANVIATLNIRNTGNYSLGHLSHNANMNDEEDKNGGPNHLRAWMKYRKMKGVDLANALGGNVTPGMVSDLANSKRALSAKWLRRLAPALDTTPGMLLDHDPNDLDSDMVEVWATASTRQKKQINEIAKTILKTGTDDN